MICSTLWTSKLPQTWSGQVYSNSNKRGTTSTLCGTTMPTGVLPQAPQSFTATRKIGHTHLYIYILNMVLRVPFGGVPHASRASHKLFSKKILRPSTTSYTHISQKVLKGVAARFVIYWLRPLLHSVALADGGAYAVRLVN